MQKSNYERLYLFYVRIETSEVLKTSEVFVVGLEDKMLVNGA
jgi:hypothetical protein